MTPPVLLLIFNRPDHTEQVMEQIRQAEPPQLFVGADGPRADHPGDAERCERAREVATRVDWDCEVHTLFREENLGCGKAPSSAITWFFDHVESGIILEDDCVPDPSFFPFCGELLKYYADTPQVMHINGNTYGLDQRSWNDYSYGFGNYPHAWGWATWQDAWEEYNFEIPSWPAFKEARMLRNLPGGEWYAEKRRQKWNRVYERKDLQIWDYQWQFAVMKQSGIAVVPEVNLVRNIGYGEHATHTNNGHDKSNIYEEKKIRFPIRHPQYVLPDKRINKKYQHKMIRPGVRQKLKYLIKKISGAEK